MKTLFRTFGFPLLALIAVIVVLAIRGLAQPTTTPSATRCPDPQDMLVNVKIGKPSGPGYTCKPDDTFVKLKDPNQDPAVKGGLNDQLDALYSWGGANTRSVLRIRIIRSMTATTRTVLLAVP
jgi:hypothetical protein